MPSLRQKFQLYCLEVKARVHLPHPRPNPTPPWSHETSSMKSRLLIGALSFCAATGLNGLGMAKRATASPPTEAAQVAQVTGKPVQIEVTPKTLDLDGQRSARQILIQGIYADKTVRDLTPFAQFQVEGNAPVRLLDGGYVESVANGTGTIKIQVAGQEKTLAYSVKGMEKARPVSFRHEVIAALNVGGCNMGACHGTPSGKNGFKLSLRGFDPAADYLQLTRDVLARRTVAENPDASLLMLKAMGRAPHEGGQRFAPSAVTTRAVRQWMAEGMANDPQNLPAVKKVTIEPGSLSLIKPAKWQQLAITASFEGGRIADVTRLSNFSSSDPSIAEVSATGLVEFRQPGEVAILVRYLEELVTVRLSHLEPKPNLVWVAPKEINYIDQLTFSKLKTMGILPSAVCSDADFVRRVYLDICGILPDGTAVKEFLADKDPNKRTKLIDNLLDRPEYADFWTMKWSDVLRSSRKNIQVKGIHVFQDWLKGHIAANTGIDKIVQELLTSSGSTFGNPPANYYRIAKDSQNLAETTAQLFFGIRMQCAKCHNHPFERWSQDDYYSMAAFFSQVAYKPDPEQPGPKPETPGAEIVFVRRDGEVTQPRTGKVMKPKFMGGDFAKVEPGQDRRVALAEWITSGDNPFFAKATVNRIWFHLLGKGIVDPVDDFRESNPSANDPLLEALAKDFIKSGFNLKQMVRTICLSNTYQLSTATNENNKDDNKYFSHAVSKLLSAEQLLDAICKSTEIGEKFPGLPMGTRATQLPDTEINHLFLKTFGQPARELACECERESDSNLAQALQLINGPTINDKLKGPTNRIGRLITAKKTDKEILEDIYLETLSRFPTKEDSDIALAHLAKAKDKRKGWEDIQWALINTKEFLFRH